MKYLLVDAANTYFRSIHASRRGLDIEERVAFALHVTMQGIQAAWRDQNADHVVMLLEGKSWRRKFYAPYKKNRDVKRAAASKTEQEESAAYFEGFSDLIEFIETRTNVTVLQHPELEADDLIAGWVQHHPQDDHVIISSDSDFYQLLAPNVSQYNGISQELHTINGIFDYQGKPVINKKTKLPKTIPDPKFILFEKIVRGDSTDYIFSAYPGVRAKSSKSKIGLIEAFADRDQQGYAWCNFMLTRWMHHDGTEHRVKDDFERNRMLIDLSAQPPEIRAIIDATIANIQPKEKPQLGVYFLKFCGKHELNKLSERANQHIRWLSAPVKGH